MLRKRAEETLKPIVVTSRRSEMRNSRRRAFVILVSMVAVGSVAVYAGQSVTATDRNTPISNKDVTAMNIPPLLLTADAADEILAAAGGSAPISAAVTLGEYVAAVETTAKCIEDSSDPDSVGLRDATVTVTVMEPSSDNFLVDYTIAIDYGPDGAATAVAQAAGDAFAAGENKCRSTYLRDTQERYQVGLMSDPKYVAGINESFTECLDGVPGLTVSPGLDARENMAKAAVDLSALSDQRLEAFASCVEGFPSVATILTAE
jgi:hypothetical protein